MRERGIPFTAEMVRAILNDTKTQTRRMVAGLDPDDAGLIGFFRPMLAAGAWQAMAPDNFTECSFFKGPNGTRSFTVCPYGVVGDRLWVREAWRLERHYDEYSGGDLDMQCDWPRVAYCADDPDGEATLDAPGRYRHARFMPRWASRITVENTDVRVQRLHDISEQDARSEGASIYGDAREAYSRLWNRINGEGAWAANPWVWAITFKRIDASAS